MTAAGHPAQHASFKLLAQDLEVGGSDAQRQWALVMIFYAALHVIQGTLIMNPGSVPPPADHTDRANELYNRYGHIAAAKPAVWAYLRLHRRANKARYEGYAPIDLVQAWDDLRKIERYIV